MDLLQYGFFQHALLGSLLTAIACGIVGTYIVSRRLVFISGGITHASFGGLGLGFYLGMNPCSPHSGWSGRARHRMCVKTLLLPGYGR